MLYSLQSDMKNKHCFTNDVIYKHKCIVFYNMVLEW